MTDSGWVFAALRRGWWLVLVATAVGAATAYLVTLRERPVYRADATLAVVPSRSLEDTGDLLRSLETLERRTVIATYAEMVGRAETKESAAERLGVELSELRAYWIGGSVIPNTNLLRVVVQGPDPRRAAEVADAAADATRRDTRGLYRAFSLRRVEAAVPPRRPDRPQPVRNVVIGTFLGLFAGLGVALGTAAIRGWT